VSSSSPALFGGSLLTPAGVGISFLQDRGGGFPWLQELSPTVFLGQIGGSSRLCFPEDPVYFPYLLISRISATLPSLPTFRLMPDFETLLLPFPPDREFAAALCSFPSLMPLPESGKDFPPRPLAFRAAHATLFLLFPFAALRHCYVSRLDHITWRNCLRWSFPPCSQIFLLTCYPLAILPMASFDGSQRRRAHPHFLG